MLEDKYNFENYKFGGIIEEVRFPKEMNYAKLKDRFYIPYLEGEFPDINDYSKEGRNELLHLSFLAIHNYYKENKLNLPEINNSKQANIVLEKAKLI